MSTLRQLAAGLLALHGLGLSAQIQAEDTRTATPSASLTDVEAQMDSTNRRLAELAANIEANKQARAQLEKAIQSVSGRVQERQQRLAALGSDIERYDQQLSRLESQVSAANADIDARRATLALSLRRSQRIAEASGLKVVLQQDDPALADRLGVYTGYFMRAQQNAIEAELQALETIRQAHDEALKNRNWLNYIQDKAASQRDSLVEQRSARESRLSSVQSELSSQTRSVAQLKADQARLQALMEELKAAAARASGYFESGQGQYDLPVKGRLQARFGDPKSVGRVSWTGWFLRADAGTPVRAIADGEVVYSDYLQGFGMLVIVDHGDAWMTLYGGNRDVLVPAGNWVESGATLATVGDSGGQNVSGLYFEIRHNAKPVDPEAWISSRNVVLAAKK